MNGFIGWRYRAVFRAVLAGAFLAVGFLTGGLAVDVGVGHACELPNTEFFAVFMAARPAPATVLPALLAMSLAMPVAVFMASLASPVAMRLVVSMAVFLAASLDRKSVV